MKGQAEDSDAAVDGVPGQIALWPAPGGVFDDQARVSGHEESVQLAHEGLEAACMEQGERRGYLCVADFVSQGSAWYLRKRAVTFLPSMRFNGSLVCLL